MGASKTIENPSKELSKLSTEHSSLCNEPEWLTIKRLNSLADYDLEQMPDRVSHLWRYSDPQQFEFITGKDHNLFTNRLTINFSSNQKTLPKGVIFKDLNEALLDESANIIKKNIYKLTGNIHNKFVCFNDALWTNGYFLYVPDGVKLEAPLIAKLLINDKNKYFPGRVLIVLGENASVNLIEDIISSNDLNLKTNITREIFLGKGAKLNFLNLQILDNSSINYAYQNVSLSEKSELTNLIVSIGGKISKSDIDIALKGTASTANIYGLVLGDKTQRFDHHTFIHHIAKNTKSLLDFRVALKNNARSAYTGNLRIEHDAIKSDAKQENRNLLLSKDAKAESIPELEILTGDVLRCNHGVTVGQVEKEQLYYLTSRGLNEKEAEKLIIEGFFEPTISKVTDESFKEEIRLKINEKLENT